MFKERESNPAFTRVESAKKKKSGSTSRVANGFFLLVIGNSLLAVGY